MDKTAHIDPQSTPLTRPVPDILFKYCDPSGAAILTNLELKFTPPEEFNDPFEISPGCDGEVSVEALRKAEPKIYALMLESARLLHPKLPPEAHTAIAEAVEKFKADEVSKSCWATFRTECAIASQVMGVICLSGDSENIQMWSHYADKHQGFVVGFDRCALESQIRNALKEQDGGSRNFDRDPRFKKVDYDHPRPIESIESVLTGIERHSTEDKFFAKAPGWKYEDEYRLALGLNEPFVRMRQNGGRRQYFLPIQPAAIHSVILGARAGKALESCLRSAAERLGKRDRVAHVSMDDQTNEIHAPLTAESKASGVQNSGRMS